MSDYPAYLDHYDPHLMDPNSSDASMAIDDDELTRAGVPPPLVNPAGSKNLFGDLIHSIAEDMGCAVEDGEKRDKQKEEASPPYNFRDSTKRKRKGEEVMEKYDMWKTASPAHVKSPSLVDLQPDSYQKKVKSTGEEFVEASFTVPHESSAHNPLPCYECKKRDRVVRIMKGKVKGEWIAHYLCYNCANLDKYEGWETLTQVCKVVLPEPPKLTNLDTGEPIKMYPYSGGYTDRPPQ